MRRGISFAAALVLLVASCNGTDSSAVPGDRRPAAVVCPQNRLTGDNGTVGCSLSCPSADSEWPGFCTQGICVYDECTSDDDCTNGGVCSCAGETIRLGGSSKGNVCVPANCRIDANCGSGTCSPSRTKGRAFGVQGYYCHTSADTCSSDAQCLDACAFDATAKRWSCITTQ